MQRGKRIDNGEWVYGYPWPKGRGTIAAQADEGQGRRICRVSMAERPWHNCSPSVPYIRPLSSRYPWPKGRGTIAARCVCAVRKHHRWYPWPKGRGTIAAGDQAFAILRDLGLYPWPKGRGTIAAAGDVTGTVGGVAGIHGRKAVAQLQQTECSPNWGQHTCIHGRKAVAQLQLVLDLRSRPCQHVSMAERPWHNCSAIAFARDALASAAYPWPKGRGTIAASGLNLWDSRGFKYPWPKGRGTIAAY